MKIVDRMALLNSATGKVCMEYTPARLFIYFFGFGKATSIIFLEEDRRPQAVSPAIKFLFNLNFLVSVAVPYFSVTCS